MPCVCLAPRMSIFIMTMLNDTALQTTDPYYKTQDGKMFYSTNFTPGYETATFEDLQLFIRYSAFWLQRGTHNLKFHVVLYNNQTKTFFSTSEWQRFQLVQK